VIFNRKTFREKQDGKSRTGKADGEKQDIPEVTLKHPAPGSRMLRSCAKAEGFRDSAERPVDGPDLRAMRGDARGEELSINEAEAGLRSLASRCNTSYIKLS
jgi:hypothetical protein